jgi:PAS domain S-box-containing protein
MVSPFSESQWNQVQADLEDLSNQISNLPEPVQPLFASRLERLLNNLQQVQDSAHWNDESALSKEEPDAVKHDSADLKDALGAEKYRSGVSKDKAGVLKSKENPRKDGSDGRKRQTGSPATPASHPGEPAPLSDHEIRAAIMQLNDGFVILNAGDQVVFANQEFTTDTGQELANLIGKGFWEAFPFWVDTPLYTCFLEVKQARQPRQVSLPSALEGAQTVVRISPTQDGTVFRWMEPILPAAPPLKPDAPTPREEADSARRSVAEARLYSRLAHAANLQTQTIFNNLIAVGILQDEGGIIQMANSYAIALFGFDPLRYSYETIFHRVHIEDEDGRVLQPAELPHALAARGQFVENRKVTFTNQRGRRYTLLVSAMPVLEGSQVRGAVSVWNDITRQERLLDENRSQKRLLEKIITHAPVGIAVLTGPEHRLTLTNPIIQQMTRRADSCIGRTAAEIWPEVAARILPALERIYETGEPFQDQDLLFRPAQEPGEEDVFFTFTFTPLFNPRGQVESILALLNETTHRVNTRRQLEAERDRLKAAIQEQKAISVQLRESNEHLRVVMASAPIYIFTKDTAHRFLWFYKTASPEWYEHLVGKTNQDLFSPDLAAEFDAIENTVFNSGEALQKEVKMEFSGEMKHYITTVAPNFDGENRVSGLTLSAFDITPQRQIEAQQAEKTIQVEVQRRLMDHREQERQEIARNIHDGPIQNMVSNLFNLQMAKESIHDRAALSAIQEVVTSIKNSVQELRDVVNELRPPMLLHFGLARAIQIHTEDIRTRVPNLTFDLDMDENENTLPEEMCLALYRIYQEGMNNILRHAQADRVAIRYFREADQVVLEIKDNGKGFIVPPDWGDLTRKNHFGVPGMRERVEAIGGAMQLTSQPNHGTTIRVSIGQAAIDQIKHHPLDLKSTPG